MIKRKRYLYGYSILSILSTPQSQKSLPDRHSARQLTTISPSGGQDGNSENVRFLSRYHCNISYQQSWNCADQQCCLGASLKRFWTTVCKKVRPLLLLLDRCPICPVCLVMSVCDVGVLWPNDWMDQDEMCQL